MPCAEDWTAGAVWQGGEALAEFLVSNTALVAGKRLLELGTGTGIGGLAAAAAGATMTTLTDQHIEQARANVALNVALSSRVRVRELHWGAGIAAPNDIDLVIGADLIYPTAESALALLLTTLSKLHTATLLVYVERSSNTTARLRESLERLPARCRWQSGLGSRHAGKTSLIALDQWSDHATAGKTRSACVATGKVTTLV